MLCIAERTADGLRQIRGFPEEDGLWLAAARGKGYGSIDAIWRRAGLPRRTLERLAATDGFATYGLNRREALWQLRGLGGDKPLELFRQSLSEARDGQVQAARASESNRVWAVLQKSRIPRLAREARPTQGSDHWRRRGLCPYNWPASAGVRGIPASRPKNSSPATIFIRYCFDGTSLWHYTARNRERHDPASFRRYNGDL